MHTLWKAMELFEMGVVVVVKLVDGGGVVRE